MEQKKIIEIEKALKQLLSELDINDDDIIVGFQSCVKEDRIYQAGKLYGLSHLADSLLDIYIKKTKSINDKYNMVRFLLIYGQEFHDILEAIEKLPSDEQIHYVLIVAIPFFKSFGVLKKYVVHKPNELMSGVMAGRDAANELTGLILTRFTATIKIAGEGRNNIIKNWQQKCKGCGHIMHEHYELVPYNHGHPKSLVGVCKIKNCKCNKFISGVDNKLLDLIINKLFYTT